VIWSAIDELGVDSDARPGFPSRIALDIVALSKGEEDLIAVGRRI
jgi:hypothetical protein